MATRFMTPQEIIDDANRNGGAGLGTGLRAIVGGAAGAVANTVMDATSGVRKVFTPTMTEAQRNDAFARKVAQDMNENLTAGIVSNDPGNRRLFASPTGGTTRPVTPSGQSLPVMRFDPTAATATPTSAGGQPTPAPTAPATPKQAVKQVGRDVATTPRRWLGPSSRQEPPVQPTVAATTDPGINGVEVIRGNMRSMGDAGVTVPAGKGYEFDNAPKDAFASPEAKALYDRMNDEYLHYAMNRDEDPDTRGRFRNKGNNERAAGILSAMQSVFGKQNEFGEKVFGTQASFSTASDQNTNNRFKYENDFTTDTKELGLKERLIPSQIEKNKADAASSYADVGYKKALGRAAGVRESGEWTTKEKQKVIIDQATKLGASYDKLAANALEPLPYSREEFVAQGLQSVAQFLDGPPKKEASPRYLLQKSH